MLSRLTNESLITAATLTGSLASITVKSVKIFSPPNKLASLHHVKILTWITKEYMSIQCSNIHNSNLLLDITNIIGHDWLLPSDKDNQSFDSNHANWFGKFSVRIREINSCPALMKSGFVLRENLKARLFIYLLFGSSWHYKFLTSSHTHTYAHIRT